MNKKDFSGGVEEALKTIVSKNNPLPLFIQIERGLEKIILQAGLKPGDLIPPATRLAEVLNVSPLTINKSMLNLVKKGLIVRRQRTGTFVSENLRLPRRTIGFFYIKESEIVMLQVAEALQEQLAGHGLDLKLFPFENHTWYDDVDVLRVVEESGINGAVFVLMNTGGCLHGLQRLEQAGFPHVRFGNQFFTGQLRAPLITGHDQLAVRQALDKLWALGHRRIGHITSVPGNPDDCMFMNFFQTRQTVCPPAWTVHLNFSITPRRWRERHGEHIIRGFLEKNRELTAIIVQNGIVCFDVVQQALASDRQLPEDLSIISLRDRLGLDLLQPAVSSFHLPVATISRRCAVEMLQVLKDGLPHRERVSRTEFTFIERASLAPAAVPPDSSTPRKPVSVKIEHSIDHMQNR